LSQPARPVAPSAPGTPVEPGGASQFGATTASDLVNALNGLLNVQNDFLSVWVDNEVQRLNLDFQLGVMELDPNGLRIEHHQPLTVFLEETAIEAPCELPSPCAGVQTTTAVLKNPATEPATDSMIPAGPNAAPTSREPKLLPGGSSDGAAPLGSLHRHDGTMQTVALLPVSENFRPGSSQSDSGQTKRSPVRLPATDKP
jgi:hypothetical protein